MLYFHDYIHGSPILFFASFLAIWLLCLCLFAIYCRTLHPLANVPGPLAASFSRFWLIKHSHAGNMHRTMIAMHAKYGRLVRVAHNEVSISDPQTIKTVYGAGSKYVKSDWYSVWQGHRKFDLFAERDDKVHGRQRALVSRAYSMASLCDLEQYVDDTIKVFLDKMAEAKGRVDLGKWVQLYAFDIIGEISFSRSFNFLQMGTDDGTFHAIERLLHSAAWIGQVPWLFWLNDYLTPWIGNKIAANNRHGSVRDLASKEVESRKDRGSDRKDLLGKLLSVHNEKPEQFDHAALVSMATSNIGAGSDTTAISIRAAIYYLLQNPAAKQRLLDEIHHARSQGKLSDPVQIAEANDMPYLQACLFEALRLHPAVGMSLPRVVPEGGTTVNNVCIPAGTIIGANPWVVHRLQSIFGEDVDDFRPERWLGADTADMRRFFFAFGAGARSCIGRNISWMEMSKLIPTLFMHFDMELEDPDEELEEVCWWFVMQKGLHVRLRQRVVSDPGY